MSFKSRIYLIVVVLIVVAIFIAGVGIYSMRTINTAMEYETLLADRVSEIKDLRSNMQNVLIGVREIMLSEDAAQMRVEKAALDELVANEIDPALASVEVLAQDQQRLRELQALWTKHKDIVSRIYTNTSANTDYLAAKLTMEASMDYWGKYEDPIRKLASSARNLGTRESIALAFTAMEVLEAMNSMQVHEKMVVMAQTAERRRSEDALAREEKDRYDELLDRVERALTNSKVGDAELRAFNAAFEDAVRDRLQFNDDGTVTVRAVHYPHPANFINPDMESVSRIYWEQIKPLRGNGSRMYGKVSEMAERDSNGIAFRILVDECNPTRQAETSVIGELVTSCESELHRAVEAAGRDYQRAWWALVIVAAAGLVIGLVLSFISVTRINRALVGTITNLTDRSQDVNRIADQLAAGSESLAEGANEQAASLEETSSALEQMASMTRQNADNATKTRETAKESLELITAGSATLQTVTQAMSEINESSEKISNIIKTIEEIAFQTNLLALNAAVEAARAGEAGKGFAVVADEVRNLASRSAQAAKDTSELIESTVTRVRAGSEHVSQLATAFQNIESESQNVDRLVAEITAATNEQAQGVDQVNTAVAQMDKVTQTNAATAEESAGAASELSQQSTNLNGLVQELASLVHGGRKGDLNAPVKSSRKNGNGRSGNGNGYGGGGRTAQPLDFSHSLPAPGPRVMRPSDIEVVDDF